MKHWHSIHKWLIRTVTATAICLLLPVLSGPVVRFFCDPHVLSMVIFLQTGRMLPQDTPPTKSITPIQITQQTPILRGEGDAVVSFSPEDMDFVEVYNHTINQPDLETLLTSPLNLEVSGDAPSVLILHSHTTESYTGVDSYVEPYRTLDKTANMIAIGEEVKRVLELGGISVIHDTTIYDYPDYNSAYNASREAAQAYLQQYPTISLVLDLHRDAAAGDAGQLVTQGTVSGQPSAQLMMVVGTNGTGLNHPDWETNLALALKLNVVLEQTDPGITRPVTLRNQRFNGDLSPGSLLVEVGAAGNTLEEAILAANALARAILKLA